MINKQNQGEQNRQGENNLDGMPFETVLENDLDEPGHRGFIHFHGLAEIVDHPSFGFLF